MEGSLRGLIAAVFTPMREDEALDLGRVGAVVEHLLGTGISAMYVCGSTGEGPSLSTDERKATTEAYVEASAGRLPAIVQVGHNSLTDACELATHAASVGADAISALPPAYYAHKSVDTLVDCLARIAGACELPFYYYHIPAMSGVNVNVLDLLERVSDRITNFAGLKYTAPTLDEYQGCVEFDGGRFNVMFGRDEMLLPALSIGATGAVGTTYNFAGPLYRRLWDAFDDNDLTAAAMHQSLSQSMIRALYRHGGMAAFKTTMRLIGVDCGPCRLPLGSLTEAETERFRADLESIGFFDWAL